MPSALFALVFAAAASAGGLYLSLGLGYVACPLCFYQRAFAFALTGVLLVGLLMPGRQPGRLCVLALPPAVGGLGVAGFHTYLVASGVLACPPGIEELGSAPAQSLAAFALATLALGSGVLGEVKANKKLRPAVVAAVLVGAAAGYGSLVANPAPKRADKPLAAGEAVTTCVAR